MEWLHSWHKSTCDQLVKPVCCFSVESLYMSGNIFYCTQITWYYPPQKGLTNSGKDVPWADTIKSPSMPKSAMYLAAKSNCHSWLRVWNLPILRVEVENPEVLCTIQLQTSAWKSVIRMGSSLNIKATAQYTAAWRSTSRLFGNRHIPVIPALPTRNARQAKHFKWHEAHSQMCFLASTPQKTMDTAVEHCKAGSTYFRMMECNPSHELFHVLLASHCRDEEIPAPLPKQPRPQ